MLCLFILECGLYCKLAVSLAACFLAHPLAPSFTYLHVLLLGWLVGGFVILLSIICIYDVCTTHDPCFVRSRRFHMPFDQLARFACSLLGSLARFTGVLRTAGAFERKCAAEESEDKELALIACTTQANITRKRR